MHQSPLPLRAAPLGGARKKSRALLASAAFAALTLGGGCSTPAYNDPVRAGPFFVPVNVLAEPTLGGIRRVVVLPVSEGTVAAGESAAELDAVVVAALQEQNRFEVVTLSREQCRRRFQLGSLSSTAALPADLLPALKREFAADAVLFVDLTVFRAYRPLALGLRGKLAVIDGTRIVWTFDNVFSADDPAVANAARHHFLQGDRAGVPADLTPAVLQSPAKFAAYAAAAMFATLPPVNAPRLAENAKSVATTRSSFPPKGR